MNPLRDRAWGLLVQALGGAGRQADALAAFREYHAYLAEWVGTEPSAEVRRIERQIAAGWDGVEAGRDLPGEQDRPARSGSPQPVGSGSPQPVRPPSWRGNGWLPLQAELARGPTLVGRARELGLLAGEAAQVGGSGVRAVIVEGEAGIGKTTVLGAFARTLRDEGSAAVLYGRCQDGPAVPLEPFRSLIGHLVDHAPVDVLRAHTMRCGGHLVRVAPRLAGRVELAGAPVRDDATERHLLFEAVSDLLTRLAAISPLAVLLDDVPPSSASPAGPREIASDLLGEAAAAGFRNVAPDLMWMTSMLGYAILAIELEDLDAAAQLLAIIEPYAGEIATNLGPVAAYAGRLASLLGRHDIADHHLSAALGIADAFDWDYHRAAILIAWAAARRRSLGRIDDPARTWLEAAEGICAAHGLTGMLAMIGGVRE